MPHEGKDADAAVVLEQYSFEKPVAFLDSDMLVTGDLASVFQKEFDVALTWRKSDEMPFNGGAIYVNNACPEKGRQFFRELEKIYLEKFENTSIWYGDQFALANLVDLPFSEIGKDDLVVRKGIRIGLLPCDRYNFSPNGECPNLFHVNRDALLYHFKGMGRRTMRAYWDLQFSPDVRSVSFRRARMLWLNLRYGLERRRYKRRLKRDLRRFNCRDQDEAAWIDRAEIAVSLIEKGYPENSHRPIFVADMGCGDRKLARILSRSGKPYAYSGYDLNPQDVDVRKFDIERDEPSQKFDFVAMLGVLEYAGDVRSTLSRFRPFTDVLVVSHAVSDLRRISASRRRKLNWKSHLSKDEFEKCLMEAGFTIRESRVTANNRSIVWMCS